MKSNYGAKQTVIDNFETENFVKLVDFLANNPNFTEGSYNVVGIIKTNAGKYGTSYSLAIKEDKEKYFLNIPQWLGSSIYEDFLESNESAADYFNSSIKNIETIDTKQGKSHRIIFY